MDIFRFTKESYEKVKVGYKKIYIYGTSYESGTLLRVLTLAGIDVLGFIEEDKSKSSDLFHSCPIIDISDILSMPEATPIVVFIMEKMSEEFIKDKLNLDIFCVTVSDYDILGNSWLDIIGQVPDIYQSMYAKHIGGGGIFEYIKEITFPVNRIYKNGTWIMSDYFSTYVNIKNGERLINRKKAEYSYNLYLLGQSFLYGYGCEDQETIGNYLQKHIDDLMLEYEVHNLAVIGQTFMEMYQRLLTLPIKTGDLIIITNAIFAFPIKSDFEKNTVEDNSFICYYLLEKMFKYCQNAKAEAIFVKIPSVNDVAKPNMWEQKLQKLNYQEENKRLGRAVTSDSSNVFLSVDWNTVGLLCVSRRMPYFNAKEIVNHKRDEEVFYDWLHLNSRGNQLIADFIFNCIVIEDRYNSKYDSVMKLAETVENTNEDKAFQAFLNGIKEKLPNEWQHTIGGCIVMNANPFTKGHLYLIDSALKSVDWLIVFVLAEDKSDFSYEERIELVNKGTKNLKNVIVVPSGEYIISHATFPEYFNKNSLQQDKVDASLDIDIFGKKIAKELNIKKRFVGEEPYCMVTKQYNLQMEQKLPLYGVEFIEIPRLEMHGTAISASNVRRLISDGDVNELKEILPQSTLDYILSSEKWLGNKNILIDGVE